MDENCEFVERGETSRRAFATKPAGECCTSGKGDAAGMKGDEPEDEDPPGARTG